MRCAIVTMFSLNEMFGSQSKGNSPALSTYNTHEAGGLDLSYQLEMTVNAKVENLSSEAQENLVTFMKNKFGSECNIDKRSNTIFIYSINGLDTRRILKHVKKSVDRNAYELGKA